MAIDLAADTRIPVTLLTGFLGSGKTTLLRTLLSDASMAGCAVLINEVGEIGLDHLLVQELSEESELAHGGGLAITAPLNLKHSTRRLHTKCLIGHSFVLLDGLLAGLASLPLCKIYFTHLVPLQLRCNPHAVYVCGGWRGAN